ncbi:MULTISPECIES: glycosyltransferase [Butyricimonas]|uniref:glycosyltransferase n=1 Tax=Butyricimonas TaxID=574697 RepID=UPI0007FB28A9|nr:MULTISPECIES: glycosyltransferase [Butyricimonas]
MKKALFVATVYRFFNFEKSDMQILNSMGYEIHTASNMKGADWLVDDGYLDFLMPIKHHIDFGRSPFSKSTIHAYKQLKKLLKENHYDIIHCHTPVASAIARLAAIGTRRAGTKIIYTDHGFHFHRASSLINWILFYPIEYIMAFFTDMIITINKEDYAVIRRFNTPKKKYIPGVGVDIKKIAEIPFDRTSIRKKYNIPDDGFVILSVGELSARKNQGVIIRALAKLNNKNIYYILCGTGQMETIYKELSKKLSLVGRVIFAGFQPHEEVFKIAHSSDIVALPSRIEGLGLAGIESMAAGLPVIASGVHGIKDYVIDNETGITCRPTSVDDFANAINLLYTNSNLYKSCKENAKQKAWEFDINKVRKLMTEYYKEI